ncbi:hypothetical protein [Nocardia takedensis]|uniref:hypothetical protein n=1 Tax=Nocardia takedensis TaxID=259390 RepID=UPI0002E932A8|nr:hypothetical protein [Nocardia takedensis]
MARVVLVHGIGSQVSGEQSMLTAWLPALNDGLTRAHATPLTAGDVAAGFYGDLYRPPGRLAGRELSPGEQWYGPADVGEGFEQELLVAWWKAAADLDPSIRLPTEQSLSRTWVPVQSVLHAVARQRFFAGVAIRSVIGDLKQVSRYMLEPELRHKIRDRVRALITDDTRVVVAHSLGSVVAYEALCSLPGHPVRALVTVGSPLGLENLIFDRLQPAPVDGRGAWPGRDGLVWTNIADKYDLVAMVKQLDPLFGGGFTHRVWDWFVDNSSDAHGSAAYLTDEITGRAIDDGLHAH